MAPELRPSQGDVPLRLNRTLPTTMKQLNERQAERKKLHKFNAAVATANTSPSIDDRAAVYCLYPKPVSKSS